MKIEKKIYFEQFDLDEEFLGDTDPIEDETDLRKKLIEKVKNGELF